MREQDVAELVRAAGAARPSLVVGVLAPGGRTVDATGDGPRPGGRLFQIGSVTKVFTTLVLARLVVRGEVSLDQPVAELLASDVRWPSGPAVTLGELATHTAGLPRIPPGTWGKVLRRDQDPYADLDAAALHRALSRTRLRGRGRRRYSNFGVGLLGHALAHNRGTTWEQLVRDQVTQPLGLTDTVVQPTHEHAARVATGHGRRGAPRPGPWHFADAMAGCGALWSTADDMLAFLAAQVSPPPGELGAAVRLTQEHDLGWFRMPGSGAAPGWFHNGGTDGFRSMVVVRPRTGHAVVALTDCDRSVDGLALRVLAAIAPPV